MSNKAFNARHGISVGTTPTDVIDNTGEVLTNAASATKLKTARTIQLSGDVAGSASFDGTADINITATVQPNSVALGTDTTGNYMIDVAAGTGVTVSHTQSEGSTATVSIGQAVASTDSPTFANLTLTGELRGPANFVIDPAAVGDNTGTVVIKGNLQIDGTTTTVNSTTTTVDDTVITLGGDTAPTTDDTFDRGVDFRWYDTQARLGFFGFDRSTGKFTFIPRSTLASGVYSGTKGEVDAYLDWSNVLNKPTIDNTTYSHLAVTTTGGAFLRLTASGGGTDDVKFASGTNATVAYTDDDTITISSSDTTYSVKASTQTGGAGLDLDAGGSGSGTDTVKFLGSGGTTVARTDADTITISSTAVNDGTLSASAATAGATNTTIALNFSGAYSANTANNRTINPVVGPAITALATTMTGATTGFLKKTGADTYTLDTNTYLTSAGDGALSVAARSAGATNTDVTLELSGVYSANTATDRTIKAVVGPSLTALATLMTGATTGFVKKTGADTYVLDTNTYLTSYTDTNTTYTLDGQTTATNDVDIQLIAGGSGSGTDSIKFVGAGATTVAWDEANQKVTVTSTDTQPNDGTLSVAARVAGATTTDVTLELSGAYSANTSNNRTIRAVVGPALTALASLMATAGPGFIRRTATADTFSVDTSTYLTSYTETDTLSSVTGRGASTSTNITLSGGTTYLGSASTNYITTSDNGSIIVRTKDQTTRQSSLLNLQTGNSTLAGSNSGSILIKTGNATGGSDAFAGDISMYPGTSDGQGAIVAIYGGDSYGGTTSSGGYVQIKGGSSSTTTGTTTANGGNVYIYGGSITSANNFTKNTGSIYMEGGGATGSGTITYGTINIGRTSGSSSYGTSAVYIGNGLITTTISGTVKLPDVGTSGFVKLGAGGQLSADTNTYLTAEADTLATVTGRGNTTTSTIQHGGLSMSDGTNVDQLKTFSQSLTLTTSWQDTGISSNNLSTGSYVVQVTADDYSVGGQQYNERYTGFMSWFESATNSTVSDEIVLHRAGHAPNGGTIFLRTLRGSSGVLKLQIAGTTTNTATSTYVFKFRRLI